MKFRVLRRTNLREETHQKDNLRILDLKLISKIATNLTMALCVLHKDGAIHADIKPENCLIRKKESNIHKDSANINEYQQKDSSSSNNLYSSTRKSVSPNIFINSSSILKSDILNKLPENFDLQLCDFGNSIHISDVAEYCNDYEIQTLAYRSPEVLLGIPFGYQIDLWSLGVLLFEICVGKPLFVVRTRQELYDSICEKLTVPPRVRFAGGLFSELLTGSEVSKLAIPDWGLEPSAKRFSSFSASTLNSKINFAEHLSNIKKLIESSVSNASNELIHFLAGLLHPDPDFRLSALDAHNHPFIANNLNLPLSMTCKK